jgi:alkanesulfonate monooxygenase SsuD/methylene tetrahydromethanopterin reductase-like flavin-dependent oxidoreductase (luciferase family)
MTTWQDDGFAGELFKLTGAFLPPPPPGVQTPPLWGGQEHVEEVFAAAGASPAITRESVAFDFASLDETVARYTQDFGPFVMARGALEPQGRWPEFVSAFADLVGRFNQAADGAVSIESAYFVITVDR